MFCDDPAKWHERSETFYHQANYGQTAVYSKSLIEVCCSLHRDVALEFNKAGVKFSIKKTCNNDFYAVVQKWISLNDVHSEKVYEKLYSHLMLIINDDSESMLKAKIITYFY